MQSTCLEHAVGAGMNLMAVTERRVSMGVIVVEECFSGERTSPMGVWRWFTVVLRLEKAPFVKICLGTWDPLLLKE